MAVTHALARDADDELLGSTVFNVDGLAWLARSTPS
jgi:hypothetical protein